MNGKMNANRDRRQGLSLMAEAAAAGHNLGFETPQHKPNTKAAEVVASNAIAELVQRVVLNDENAKAVVGEISIKLEALANS